MECVLLTGERIVFEAEGWSIINDSALQRFPTTYATHKECSAFESRWGYVSWGDEKDETPECKPECNFCHEPVPECIVTLVRIESWDR